MKKEKTILLLIPNLDYGGAQRMFYYLSEYLSRFYNVIDCTFNTKTPIAYRSGNELIDLNIDAGLTLFDKAVKFLQRVRKVRKIKKERRVDLTISMLEGADYVNILSRYRDEVWFCIQGSKVYDRDFKYQWLSQRLLIPFFYNRVDKIISVSHGIMHEMQTFFKVKKPIVVIENPCDPITISSKVKQEIPVRFQKLFNSKVVSTSGRLHPQKNQKPLFSIMENLLSKDPEIKLLVLGDGPLRNEMMDESKKYDFITWFEWEGNDLSGNENLIFAGYQSNPFTFIHQSELFILPSAWEGFPLALIEAMACNVPVIAADCPTGPREILTKEQTGEHGLKEYGYLLNIPEEGNITTWARSIMEIIDNRKHQSSLSEKSKKRAEDFSTDKIFARWHAEMKELWKEV